MCMVLQPRQNGVRISHIHAGGLAEVHRAAGGFKFLPLQGIRQIVLEALGLVLRRLLPFGKGELLSLVRSGIRHQILVI